MSDSVSDTLDGNLVTGWVDAVRANLRERHRCWSKYWATIAELDQSTDQQLPELGIARCDVAWVARDTTWREEEFRSALDRYMAVYRKGRGDVSDSDR